ncbi:high-affinity iron transporter [Faunimonas pinastri]|uniref:High-affinity iron transporter n=1 Tax=Faunimonas pinastri TaxID=1855383 RepID=A0A1H9FVT5_9HYPH|nr:FTR1 family protein [Faunimonas pinastri]SEQ41994.1 high-affinity iron transporter [Faunimonas pinastri]
MLGTLIIVFREVIEAGLVVGIVLAVTRGLPGRGWWVSLGILAGVIGASIVAAFAGAISNAFEGSGQELLNAGILLVAVLMLMWHNAWMASHGREMAAELKAVGRSISTGERPPVALAVVVGVAVLREGSEIVLFLYGIVAAGTSAASMLLGGVLGLALGAVVAALGYFGLAAIPTRYIFRVTTGLISLLAAGLAAQAMQFLTQAGTVDVLGDQVWDTSGILEENSMVGRVLHTLVGYMDRPTELQILAYVTTLVLMVLLMWIAGSGHRKGHEAGKPGSVQAA